MLDEQTGWVAGTDGTILMTEDGATWSALSSPTANDLDGISFPTETDRLHLRDACGTILKSTDGGHSWAKSDQRDHHRPDRRLVRQRHRGLGRRRRRPDPQDHERRRLLADQ